MKIMSVHCALLTSFLALSGCLSDLDAKENSAVNNFSADRTICSGRLLTKIPKGAKLKLTTDYLSTEIIRGENVGSFEELEIKYKSLAKDFESKRMDEPASDYAKYLQSEGELDTNSVQFLGFSSNPIDQTVLIGAHLDQSSSKIFVELHKLIDNKHYIFLKKNLGASKYGYARDIVTDVGSRFTPLNPNEVPQRPGFCVDGGIFVDKGAPEANEEFTLVLEFPDHPDVRFSIESIAIDEPDDEEPLERRADRDLALMRQNAGSVKVINRGKREIADQRGYEIAISAASEAVEGARMRKFFWGAQGVPNDVSRPFLEVDMTITPTEKTGSSFTDDARAQEFWNQVLTSLRIRPGAK